MNISEVLNTLKAERALKRTPIGRPVTDFAIKVLDAVISDEKNYGVDAVKCLSCCIIVSGLLVPEGCPSCGCKDVTYDISKTDILEGV
jgi:rubrerythrin